MCHSKEFASAMLEPTIEQTIIDGANIIGGALLRLVENPTTLEEIVAEFTGSLRGIILDTMRITIEHYEDTHLKFKMCVSVL